MSQQELRQLACPKCNRIGHIYIDSKDLYHCRQCNASGFNPYPAVDRRYTKRNYLQGEDKRPKLPATALDVEIVTDYYQPGFFRFGDEGFEFTPVPNSKPQIASRVYCPKPTINQLEKFDPNTPVAQHYLKLYAKRFKNRRRYDRDLKKRAREEKLGDT